MFDRLITKFVTAILAFSSCLLLGSEKDCHLYYQFGHDVNGAKFYELVYNERHRSGKIWGKMRVTRARSVELSNDISKKFEPTRFLQDKWTVPTVKKNLNRLSNNKHTLDISKYINRHLSADLMNEIVKNEKIKIDVVAASLQDASNFLRGEHFDQLEVLPTHWVTDFNIILAYNSQTKEIRFVINVLGGDSYAQEAVAQVLYYRILSADGKKQISIRPDRIRVFREGQTPRDQFLETLKRDNLDPDIVVFGSKSELEKVLLAEGHLSIGKCDSATLCYRYYEIKGKKILSVSVEPQLFGNRAGELVRAVQSQNYRKRAFIFLGTAGSLSTEIGFGSYVVPSWHRHSEQRSTNQIQYENSALKVLKTQDFPSRMLFKDHVGQVAVDSILFEDFGWIESQAREASPFGASIVEQEGFGVISAVAARNDKAYMVYRISDLPLSGEDFASTHLRLSNDEIMQNTMKALLEDALGSL